MEKLQVNPIILIDDDDDDLDLTEAAIKELGYTNEIIIFRTADEVWKGLSGDSRSPFLIICDMNMPRMNGLEIRKKLCGDPVLKFKTMPFVFWSTGATNAQINQSFELWSQGVFDKPTSMDALKDLLKKIIEYWALCRQVK